MKKFHYSMENLLQVKRKLEDQAKISYGQARLKLTKEEEKLASLKHRAAEYEDELRKLRSSKLNLVEIKRCEEAINIMKQKAEQQAVVVRSAAHKLEIARLRLNEAMVERKIQEKLKEKAWEEYKHEFEAEEQKEVDELNNYHFSSPTLVEEDT